MAKNLLANCLPLSVKIYVGVSYGIIRSYENMYARFVVVVLVVRIRL